MSCNEETGRCDGVCSRDALGPSYIGCDYYATVTANRGLALFDFSLVIANGGTSSATVLIEGGELATPMSFEVAAGAVHVQSLPWVSSLKGCLSTHPSFPCGSSFSAAIAEEGAYHLRSDQPLTVYRYNPLQYMINEGGFETFSFSNDASLLFPTTALGTDYFVASWPRHINGPGFMSITATQDDTLVEVHPTSSAQSNGSSPALAAGMTQTVSLSAGQVWQVPADGDFTGTRIQADKAISVIGGHYCTFVPADMSACDHLEESMMPTATLGRSYVLTSPAVPALPEGKVRVVRFIATQANTTISFSPEVEAPVVLAAPGDLYELMSNADFSVSASEPILVAAYMAGQQAGGDTGDPAMTIAVPREQYRQDYIFHAPINYESNYVNIVAPTGASVLLDGEPVSGFASIPTTGFRVAKVELGTSGDGNHRISGDAPFGIQVYGYGQYTSYWLPGGLDLTHFVE
jgi:hypothetical protein